jgi:hypothetical protein
VKNKRRFIHFIILITALILLTGCQSVEKATKEISDSIYEGLSNLNTVEREITIEELVNY